MTSEAKIIYLEPRMTDDEVVTVGASYHVQIPEAPSDPTPDQIMRAIELSGVLDFWLEAEEDIYTLDDGEAP